MTRVSAANDDNKVVEILSDVERNNGFRRLKSPYSYYMMRRLRDRGLITLQETEKDPDTKKGRNPYLYVVTPEGKKLMQNVNAKWAKEKAKAEAQKKSEKGSGEKSASQKKATVKAPAKKVVAKASAQKSRSRAKTANKAAA